MSSSGGTADAGEASSSPGSIAALISSGPQVRLPEDSLAVEWWLARRAIEGDGGVPFAAEGVLALWPEHRAETDRWTFGLEFEFAVADAGWVAHELHALGLTATPDAVPYHSERPEGFWSVEHDRSVTSVFTCDQGGASVIVGGEVVSPPLRDTAESWRQVALVLDVLKRCGAEVNRSCGLHVHIGADALRDPEWLSRAAGRSWRWACDADTRQAAPPHSVADPALRAAHEPER
ncbi:MAG TPA: amidoligase family protein, partial [Chloroflexota bacterium]|nr:amidoligase family protein [Chloroflexota bacterium]